METNMLAQFGNIPVNGTMISSVFPSIKAKNNKVMELEKAGRIIRLKRGLYVVSREVTDKMYSTELMANHIYTPSYISMLSALRIYGLIPETVHTIQSMTIKHSRNFENQFGRFEYTNISREAFPVGLRQMESAGVSFVIASPEKALCDLIANTSNLNLRYKKEALCYLEDDIRFDMEALRLMNPQIFRDYISVGKKPQSINTILKLIEP